ncbi:MAG: type II toxin-antitoxin system RelE/ParE family toxin [Campylobacterales bacterium]|jgi:hypothetical protein
MIEYSDHFLQEAKKLSKKYKHLKSDLKEAVEEIEALKDMGTPLGYGLYKKRVPNSSIPTGKSGGFRIIIYQKVEDRVVLISIYSKTQKETLSDEELKALLKAYMESR